MFLENKLSDPFNFWIKYKIQIYLDPESSLKCTKIFFFLHIHRWFDPAKCKVNVLRDFEFLCSDWIRPFIEDRIRPFIEDRIRIFTVNMQGLLTYSVL